MDTAFVSLILFQLVTLILLSISELLAISNSPYSGIIHAIIETMEKKMKEDICV